MSKYTPSTTIICMIIIILKIRKKGIAASSGFAV
jgi:hypothetical protein